MNLTKKLHSLFAPENSPHPIEIAVGFGMVVLLCRMGTHLGLFW
jgi:hypothetical protein